MRRPYVASIWISFVTPRRYRYQRGYYHPGEFNYLRQNKVRRITIQRIFPE